MGMLREGAGWCLCAGGGKSERIKGAIFSGKGPALAAISSVPGGGCGTGFLIHRGLLLTTHANIPTVAAAEAAEIRLHHGRVSARLVPHRSDDELWLLILLCLKRKLQSLISVAMLIEFVLFGMFCFVY